jgi:RNA methyltransferase, TrmH family
VKVERVPTALSPQNPRIERTRELRTASVRRERGRFIIEGPTLLEEARRSGIVFEEVFGTDDALRTNAPLVAALETGGAPAYAIAERALGRISDVETPTGILAVAVLPDSDLAAILDRPGVVLLLAGINDPGNAGTLLRSAEAFGAAGVLFGRGGADPWSPKVVRGAMGSIFRLPVAAVTAEAVGAAAAAAGRPIVAATLEGELLAEAVLPANAIVAIGNERHGVAGFLSRWDREVRIEQASATESLNAAVAGSIILYALSLRRS